MLKKISLFLFVIAVIGGGISYAIYSSPDYNERQLFDQALIIFAKNSSPLENEFNKKKSLPRLSREFDLTFKKMNQPESNIKMTMSVVNNRVTLNFGEGDSELANQSVILEPYFSEPQSEKKQLRWKCLGGSVLVRYRSRNCRLGLGITSREILAADQ